MASARDSGCITVGQNLRAARRFSGPRPLRPQRMRRAQKRRNLPPLVSLLSAAPNMRAVLVPERGLSGRSTFGVLKRKGILLRSSPLQRAAPKMGAVRSLAAAPRSEAGSSRANSPAVKAGGTPALLRRNRRSHRIHHGFGARRRLREDLVAVLIVDARHPARRPHGGAERGERRIRERHLHGAGAHGAERHQRRNVWASR